MQVNVYQDQDLSKPGGIRSKEGTDVRPEETAPYMLAGGRSDNRAGVKTVASCRQRLYISSMTTALLSALISVSTEPSTTREDLFLVFEPE